MAIKTWTPPEKIVVGAALLTMSAFALTYFADREVGTFFTYLLFMLFFSGFALLLVWVYRSVGQHSPPEPGIRRLTRAQTAMLAGIAACAIYAAVQAALANGGHAVGFIVVFVISVIELSVVVLAVMVTRRLITR